MSFKVNSATSSKWGFTFVTPSGLNAAPETQYNNALKILDALISRRVLSFTTTAPPGSPTEGDMYVIPASPTGAWVGKAYYLTIYIDGSWIFSDQVILAGVFWDETNLKFVYVNQTAGTFELIDDTMTPTNVAVLSQTITDPPTQAEIVAIKNKVNEIADALDDIGILNAT